MSDQPWTIEKALEGARYLRSQLQDGKPTYIIDPKGFDGGSIHNFLT